MQFLRRWLDLQGQRDPLILRPARDVVVPLDYDAAFDCVVAAIGDRLGAHVSQHDRHGGTVEGAFGLVNNERVRCLLERAGDRHTRVHIEALPPAGMGRTSSAAVDALADALQIDS